MTEKVTRKTETTPFVSFDRIAQQLDMSVADLLEAIGQTRGTASSISKRGWVSKTTYLAAEGLLRRSRKKATSSTLLLVTIPNGKLELFQELAGGMGFKVVHICEEM